ncbi:MAG: ankyrin repeat domain-containing protein, partial [bacterium]|nr:ankyrin repeat domain-containing protein [bacterium]
SSKGHTDAVLILIRNKANVNGKESYFGHTALHEAAEGGFIGVLQVLLEAGANPEMKNKKGDTAADIAARKGFKECVDMISRFRTPKKKKERK